MDKARPMPVLFIGHGSPMNALPGNRFYESWQALGRMLPRPLAIVCISAHWETQGTWITSSPSPRPIHDFRGFPAALFAMRCPAPGDPLLAQSLVQRLQSARVRLDPQRGLDHGVWCVLGAMYPEADIPVLQLSLDQHLSGSEHYALAQNMLSMRNEGILVVSSGNIVHNFGRFHQVDDESPAWVSRFRDEVNRRISARDHAGLCDYQRLSPDAETAVPIPEHYPPLLYALALQRDKDPVRIFNDHLLSTLSMTSLVIGRLT